MNSLIAWPKHALDRLLTKKKYDDDWTIFCVAFGVFIGLCEAAIAYSIRSTPLAVLMFIGICLTGWASDKYGRDDWRTYTFGVWFTFVAIGLYILLTILIH